MRVSSHTYKVVFSGTVIDGYHLQTVANNMAKVFKLKDSNTLKKIFSGKLITLKRGLNHDQATHYSNTLHNIGADCCIEPEINILDAQLEPDTDYKRKKRHVVARFGQHNFDNVGIEPK